VTAAVLTPFIRGGASQQGATWWKRLLPVGKISYKGRELAFTRDYLDGLARAFRDQAYDQVPLQLAGDENKHTNDVERFGGKVTDMQVRGDGLWIGVQPTERGARVLADNPDVGVSARIVEAYDRSDGKFFPKAVQHVLATLDPRIPGLGSWQAVETSNDVDVTYDLSGAQFAGEDTQMPDLNADQQARLAALLEIPVEKLAALAANLNTDQLARLTGEGSQDPDPAPATDDGDLLSEAELDALADQALALDAAGLLDEDEPELPGPQREPAAAAALSTDDQMAIELAAAQGDENARQLAIITRQLDHERWQGERRRLTASGVPPFIADLAQPLLEGSGHVVDLANGDAVDAGQVMRKVLTEYAKITEQLGLGVELGSPMDDPEGESAAATARDDVVRRAKEVMGIR
jgi:hypothetical protein